MQIGEWVAVTDSGLWEDCIEHNVSFKSKKEVIESIRFARMDAAKKPRVKRIAPGYYAYMVKDYDTLHYEIGDEYCIIKLTPDNIEHYRELEEALNELEDMDE